MRQLEALLDDALSGSAPASADVRGLVDVADDLRSLLDAPVPLASTERAIFVQGASAHAPRSSILRFVGPPLAVVALIALIGFLSHAALPGQPLYSVRRAMSYIGLVRTPLEEADARIADAHEYIAYAEGLIENSPLDADAIALKAITDLGTARKLLFGLPDEARRLRRIEELETRAKTVIVEVAQPAAGAVPDAPGQGTGKGEAKSGGPAGGRGQSDATEADRPSPSPTPSGAEEHDPGEAADQDQDSDDDGGGGKEDGGGATDRRATEQPDDQVAPEGGGD